MGRAKCLVGITLITSLAFGMAACSGSKEEPVADLPEKVVIGFQVIPNGEIVAKDLGWHEKKLGVPIEWKQFSSGAEVNLAMAAGALDIALGGTCSTSVGIAQDYPFEIIWIYDVIGENEALVVREGLEIESVSDLVGKKVATPFASTTHYHLMVALKNANVDSSKVSILDMPPPEMLAAWLRGDIDAGFVWEPTLAKMLESGGRRLISSRDLAEKGFLTCDLCLVRKGFAERYPELVVNYLETQVRAVDLCQSKPQEAAAAIARQFSISQEEALRQMNSLILLSSSEQLSKEYLGVSGRKGQLVMVLKETADFMGAQKAIKSVPPLAAFSEAVNPSYLERGME